MHPLIALEQRIDIRERIRVADVLIGGDELLRRLELLVHDLIVFLLIRLEERPELRGLL